jgi:hypothetical protein
VQAVEATCEIQATAETLRDWDRIEACHLVRLYELDRAEVKIIQERSRIIAELQQGDRVENDHHCNIGPLARVASWFLDTLRMRPEPA